MKRKNFPIRAESRKAEAQVRQDCTNFERPALCCQDCPLHSNSPSQCVGYLLKYGKPMYVGRKDRACAHGLDYMEGSEYTDDMLKELASVREWKHNK